MVTLWRKNCLQLLATGNDSGVGRNDEETKLPIAVLGPGNISMGKVVWVFGAECHTLGDHKAPSQRGKV